MVKRGKILIVGALWAMWVVGGGGAAWGQQRTSGGQERVVVQVDTTAIRSALGVIGLPFTAAEILQMQKGITDQRRSILSLRETRVPNQWVPAIGFNPLPPGYRIPDLSAKPEWPRMDKIKKPLNEADLAFLTVPELAQLISSRQITSTELTKLYIKRLKQYQDTLLCVVTITEELALKLAAKADQEIAAGKYKGLLHGIPYGVKDLMSVPGYPTTWGARPYKDQHLEVTAHVVEKLTDAGAVLIAKLTSGALAMGDVWFGGTTRNPWNLKRGSSGSSAGPASATAAGLVAFAIGTETLGSIVSPSTRCGVTGLRTTYGRVGRTGTMALCWSMDKIGPICRNALDCAIVLNAIYGPDVQDPATSGVGFTYQPILTLKGLKIGYLKSLFDQNSQNKVADSTSLEVFRSLGAELIPVTLPSQFPVNAMRIILSAEAAAAFDELTLSNRDSMLNAQADYDWPNTFRTARLIPAVEYIQANRIREQLIIETNRLMADFDVIIAPSFSGNQLTLTNLTGHPCLVLPNGFDKNDNPLSISLLGNLYREDILCAIGALYQDKTQFYRKKPTFFSR
ncbi:MAG: amidase [Bacteroidales bacterium]|jgi:Asp-tRNA(Asn)/Glu-tRNA(Gln) amidotransferase A subunit family amidase